MIARIALALAVCSAPMMASGATFQLLQDSSAATGLIYEEDFPDWDRDDVFDFFSVELTEGGTFIFQDSYLASAMGEDGTARAETQYVVDAATGEIRFGIDAAVNTLEGYAVSFLDLNLLETFHVVGGGAITIGIEVTAAWSAPFVNFFAGFNYVPGNLNAFPGGSNFSLGDLGGTVGSVGRKLVTQTFSVQDGSDGFVDVMWQVQGQVSIQLGDVQPPVQSVSGFIDAMNTLKIFVQTEGNVTATPLTPGFLSNPAYTGPGVAPVPLPASGLLFLAALGGLAGLRRQSHVS